MASSKIEKNVITPKQKRFCEEYLIDLNATQAAIRAGYSKKTAKSQGQRLLTNVDLLNFIEKLRQKIEDKAIMTASQVLVELSKIGKASLKDLVNEDGGLRPLEEMPVDLAAAVSEIVVDSIGKPTSGEVILRTKIKFHSKVSALEHLGKHHGIFDKDNKQKTPVINVLNLGSGVPPSETK